MMGPATLWNSSYYRGRMHESQFVLGMQVQIIDLLYFRSIVRQGPMSTKLYSIASNYIVY